MRNGRNFSYGAHNGVLFKSLFQVTKCEHKGVSKSIDSEDRTFSNVNSKQIFNFFKTAAFYSWSGLKTHTSNILTLFGYIL